MFRFSPARCCCGCTVNFESRNPCDSNSLASSVEFTLHDPGSDLLLHSLTTDSSGKLTTQDVEPGSYRWKTASSSGLIDVECGGTYVVQIAPSKTLIVSGCSWTPGPPTLEGATITITKGAYSYTTTTNAMGRAYWHPGAGVGDYTQTTSYPGFVTNVRTLNVVSACEVQTYPTVGLLTTASGYGCCGSTLRATAVPIKHPITVTTSGGSFQITSGCSGAGCVTVGGCTVRVIASIQTNSVTATVQFYRLLGDDAGCESRDCSGGVFVGDPPPDAVLHNASSIGYTLNNATPLNATVFFAPDVPISSLTVSTAS